MNYQYEVLQSDVARSVAKLGSYVSGHSASVFRRYLRWKYEENPYLDPLLYAAIAGGRVVGVRGMFGTKWEGAGMETLVVPCAADSAIYPHHRNTEIWNQLNDLMMDDLRSRGFQFAINLSATPANFVSSILTLGWRRIGPFQPWICNDTRADARPGASGRDGRERLMTLADRWGVGELLRFSGRRYRRYRTSVLERVGRGPFAHFDGVVSEIPGDSPVRVAVDPDPAAMAETAMRFVDGKRVHHVRDQAFYSWRFRNPLSAYRFLYYRDGREGGYMVLQGNPARPRISIVDWMGTAQAFAALLTVVVHLAASTSVSVWTATMNEAILEEIRRAGFRVDPDDPGARRSGLLLLPLTEFESSVPLDVTHWDLRMIFSDRY